MIAVKNIANRITSAVEDFDIASSAHSGAQKRRRARLTPSPAAAATFGIRSRILVSLLRCATGTDDLREVQEAMTALAPARSGLGTTSLRRTMSPDGYSDLKKRKSSLASRIEMPSNTWTQEIFLSGHLRIYEALGRLQLGAELTVPNLGEEDLLANLADVDALPELRAQAVGAFGGSASGMLTFVAVAVHATRLLPFARVRLQIGASRAFFRCDSGYTSA